VIERYCVRIDHTTRHAYLRPTAIAFTDPRTQQYSATKSTSFLFQRQVLTSAVCVRSKRFFASPFVTSARHHSLSIMARYVGNKHAPRVLSNSPIVCRHLVASSRGVYYQSTFSSSSPLLDTVGAKQSKSTDWLHKYCESRKHG
jgi:hypothetical protein